MGKYGDDDASQYPSDQGDEKGFEEHGNHHAAATKTQGPDGGQLTGAGGHGGIDGVKRAENGSYAHDEGDQKTPAL